MRTFLVYKDRNYCFLQKPVNQNIIGDKNSEKNTSKDIYIKYVYNYKKKCRTTKCYYIIIV